MSNRSVPDPAASDDVPAKRDNRLNITPTVEGATNISSEEHKMDISALSPDHSAVALTSHDQTFADNTHSFTNIKPMPARKLVHEASK